MVPTYRGTQRHGLVLFNLPNNLSRDMYPLQLCAPADENSSGAFKVVLDEHTSRTSISQVLRTRSRTSAVWPPLHAVPEEFPDCSGVRLTSARCHLRYYARAPQHPPPVNIPSPVVFEGLLPFRHPSGTHFVFI